MLRQGGFDRQLRDQARSAESLTQMLNKGGFARRIPAAQFVTLQGMCAKVRHQIEELRDEPQPKSRSRTSQHQFERARDLEGQLASIASVLLDHVLVDYWEHERTGLVESKEQEELPIKAKTSDAQAAAPSQPLQLHTTAASVDPPSIQVAEEFLAIRYLSLIRGVLAHLGSLMSFVSASFVLAIVAWNSYPFQPRGEVDWVLTMVMLLLGAGIIWVFAQMHRDPILSRVTETNANELGLDFYIRILTFGAVPVITWLAYQFPEIGNMIFKFLQPGLEVMK
jgi:hypothetical protein